MRRRARKVQAVYKAMGEVRSHMQSVSEEVCLTLFEPEEVAVPVFDDICEEPATEVDVRPEDVGCLAEPRVQMGWSVRGHEMMDE